MGSPLGFPTPPMGGRMAIGGMRSPAGGEAPSGKCPTCGAPMGAAQGQSMPPSMPPQSAGMEQPDVAWQARQARRAGGGGFQGPPVGPPKPLTPGIIGPPIKEPFPKPMPTLPRPGVNDMPGRRPGTPQGGPFDGSFRNFGG